MKKRIGIRIVALLMAMLFVVSLSGCGKPWEKQVKLTNVTLEEKTDNFGEYVYNYLGGTIENISDVYYEKYIIAVEWTFEDGRKVVTTSISKGFYPGAKENLDKVNTSFIIQNKDKGFKKAVGFRIMNVELVPLDEE